MTDKLVEFVNELDKNPELQENYKHQPRTVLEQYEVSEEDIELILGNDPSALNQRFETSGLRSILWITHSK